MLSLGWNLLIAFVLVHWMHVAPIPGVIGASIVVGVLWNYPMHRLFVFPELHRVRAALRAGTGEIASTGSTRALAVDGAS